MKPGFCVLGEHIYIYVFISEGSPLSVPQGPAGRGIGSLSPHPTLHNLAPSAPQLEGNPTRGSSHIKSEAGRVKTLHVPSELLLR